MTSPPPKSETFTESTEASSAAAHLISPRQQLIRGGDARPRQPSGNWIHTKQQQESALVTAVRRQIEQLDDKLSGFISREVTRIQSQTDRLREAAVARLEAKIANLEAVQPKLTRGIAELRGSCQGLSEEMQAQIRLIDQTDVRLREWRNQLDDDMREKIVEMDEKAEQIVSSCRAARASTDEILAKHMARIVRVEELLEARSAHDDDLKVNITDLHGRLAQLEDPPRSPEKVEPANAPVSVEFLANLEKLSSECGQQMGQLRQEICDLRSSVELQEERHKSLRTMCEAKDQQNRSLMARENLEGKVKELQSRLELTTMANTEKLEELQLRLDGNLAARIRDVEGLLEDKEKVQAARMERLHQELQKKGEEPDGLEKLQGRVSECEQTQRAHTNQLFFLHQKFMGPAQQGSEVTEGLKDVQGRLRHCELAQKTHAEQLEELQQRLAVPVTERSRDWDEDVQARLLSLENEQAAQSEQLELLRQRGGVLEDLQAVLQDYRLTQAAHAEQLELLRQRESILDDIQQLSQGEQGEEGEAGQLRLQELQQGLRETERALRSQSERLEQLHEKLARHGQEWEQRLSELQGRLQATEQTQSSQAEQLDALTREGGLLEELRALLRDSEEEQKFISEQLQRLRPREGLPAGPEDWQGRLGELQESQQAQAEQMEALKEKLEDWERQLQGTPRHSEATETGRWEGALKELHDQTRRAHAEQLELLGEKLASQGAKFEGLGELRGRLEGGLRELEKLQERGADWEVLKGRLQDQEQLQKAHTAQLESLHHQLLRQGWERRLEDLCARLQDQERTQAVHVSELAVLSQQAVHHDQGPNLEAGVNDLTARLEAHEQNHLLHVEQLERLRQASDDGEQWELSLQDLQGRLRDQQRAQTAFAVRLEQLHCRLQERPEERSSMEQTFFSIHDEPSSLTGTVDEAVKRVEEIEGQMGELDEEVGAMRADFAPRLAALSAAFKDVAPKVTANEVAVRQLKGLVGEIMDQASTSSLVATNSPPQQAQQAQLEDGLGRFGASGGVLRRTRRHCVTADCEEDKVTVTSKRAPTTTLSLLLLMAFLFASSLCLQRLCLGNARRLMDQVGRYP